MNKATPTTFNQVVSDAYAAAQPLTPEEAFEQFLRLSVADGTACKRTIKAYREGLQMFLGWSFEFGKLPRAATYLTIQEYRRWLVDQGFKRATIRLRLTAVRVLFKAMQRWGIRPDDPSAGVKAPKDKESDTSAMLRKALSPAEALELLAHLPLPSRSNPRELRDLAIVILMLFHGPRVEEVSQLTEQSVDQSFSFLRIHGKGDKPRTIRLCPEARQALMQWTRCGHSEQLIYASAPLFYRMDVPGKRRLSVRGIQQTITNYLEAAGLKQRGRCAHSLRHTHAVLAKLGGVKDEALAEELGHADLKTTHIYTRAAAAFQANPGDAVSSALQEARRTMDEKQIGTTEFDGGTFNVFDNGSIIIVRHPDGTKFTHSDTIKGLEQSGFKVTLSEAAPAQPVNEPPKTEVPPQENTPKEEQQDSANREAAAAAATEGQDAAPDTEPAKEPAQA